MRKLLLAALLILLLPGCGWLIDWPSGQETSAPVLEDQPELVILPGEISCEAAGLYVNGSLAVPVVSAGEDSTRECGLWSIDYDDSGYTACCGGPCCSWGTGVPGSTGLSGEGGSCLWSGVCLAGLTCFESAGKSVCRPSGVGEWCDEQHHCAANSYCAGIVTSASGGTCQGYVTVEGYKCGFSTAHDSKCLPPMHCLCLANGDCGCWNGTLGDPCKLSSCEDGLHCVVDQHAPASGIKNVAHCLAGDAGDWCDNSSDCKQGHSCHMIDGVRYCVVELPEGGSCQPPKPFHDCEEDLVCSGATTPSTCRPLGLASEACSIDEECHSPLWCVEVEDQGQCWQGLPGSPCDGPGDCIDNGVCWSDSALEPPVCVKTLQAGQSCSVDNDYIRCLPGLFCDDSLVQPLCSELIPAAPPCETTDDCEGPNFCAPGVQRCQTGETGDPCETDNDCNEQFTCHPDAKQCFSGGYGVPCDTTLDCPENLVCLHLWDSNACFGFLEEGEPCEGDAPAFTTCVHGTQCEQTENGAICTVPGF